MPWPQLFRKARGPASLPSGSGVPSIPRGNGPGKLVPASNPGGTPQGGQTTFYVDGSTGSSSSLNRTNAEIAREYARNEYMWRCVDLIATTAASIPLYIDTGPERRLTPAEAQIDRLMSVPNPQWSGEALRYFMASSLALTNRAFLFQVFGVGRTIELWPVNPALVTVNYLDNTQVISSYTVAEGAISKTYRVQPDGRCEIIMVTRPTLGPDADLSPAAVAAPSAEVFNKILQRTLDMARNASNMSGVLHTGSELTREAVVQVKDRLDTYRAGEANSGSVMVTANADWTFTRLSEDPAPALTVDVKDSMARDVVVTMGVPTQLVGIKGNDTYNNINQARIGFVSETVIPGYLRFIVAQLNTVFLAKERGRLAINVDGLPAMVAARTALIDAAAGATMLTLNEQREMLGFGRFEDAAADIPVFLVDQRLTVGKGTAAGGPPAADT